MLSTLFYNLVCKPLLLFLWGYCLLLFLNLYLSLLIFIARP